MCGLRFHDEQNTAARIVFETDDRFSAQARKGSLTPRTGVSAEFGCPHIACPFSRLVHCISQPGDGLPVMVSQVEEENEVAHPLEPS
ncbi:hypothetical protein E2C01_046045 [Portunus trituberculatus]|uniref:Uncharacterized protein n=1 Tax=Portunus trituberculatus TaxID=210409 RepID=A0A5B7G4J3_PORTR|nr:hypothetical protein [Portunus trituberculatus]